MIVICSADAGYLPRIRPYLDSLAAVGIPHALACVDCDPPEGVTGYRVNTADLPYPPPLRHLQAGGWMCSPAAPADEVVMFTDGDILAQRGLSEAETSWIDQWPEGAVGVGYNRGPGETLAEEAARIQQRGDWPAGVDPYWPVYNTGVVVARRATWERLLVATALLWPSVDAAFAHYAKQQWAMCAALGRERIPVVLLPQTIHTHGCYQPPHGCWLDERRMLWYLNEPVVFRHHL